MRKEQLDRRSDRGQIACGVLLWALVRAGRFATWTTRWAMVVAIVWWLRRGRRRGRHRVGRGKAPREDARLALSARHRVQPRGRTVMPTPARTSWRRWSARSRAWRSPTRWPLDERMSPAFPLGGAEPQVRPQRRGLGGESSRPRPRGADRVRSRAAGAWPPCWRRRGRACGPFGAETYPTTRGAGALASAGPLSRAAAASVRFWKRLPGGLRLRRGRRGERIGTFLRHFRGRDRVGWPWFEVEAGPDDRVQSIAARQLLVA